MNNFFVCFGLFWFCSKCLDEIEQQYGALMAEGILPASPSPPPSSKIPSKGTARALGAEGGAASIPGGGGVVVEDGGEEGGGEADPDLELDDDGGDGAR